MISKGHGVTFGIMDAASRLVQGEQKKLTDISVITAKIQCIKKNEGILAPKPLGRGIWRDFYALFPGDLVGFCLIVKTNPRECPGGKPMISALSHHILISSHELPYLPKTNMKSKSSWSITENKFENHTRTQSCTHSLINLMVLIISISSDLLKSLF